MRRISERARLEGMLALRKALDGVRRGQSPAPTAERTAPPADDVDLVTPHAQSDRLERPIPERDAELLKGLDRIADSIERVAAQLDSYHQERAEHLDAIEFLLREMVIGTIPGPTVSASRPTVLGGVIDTEEHEISLVGAEQREISLVVDEVALAVDAAVEVRSRFHDRWIGGFTIAEAVNAPGRRRYRLTRRSDGIPLPILFDACDVRAAEDAFSRQHAPS
jgi:hypothetical protein